MRPIWPSDGTLFKRYQLDKQIRQDLNDIDISPVARLKFPFQLKSLNVIIAVSALEQLTLT